MSEKHQKVMHATEVARHARTIHDLRLYLRGFVHGGGKLNLPASADEIEEALQYAEMLAGDLKRKLQREVEKKD